MEFLSNRQQVQKELQRRAEERNKNHFRIGRPDDSDLVVIDSITEFFEHFTGWESASMLALHNHYLEPFSDQLQQFKGAAKALSATHGQELDSFELPAFDYTKKRKSLFSQTKVVTVCSIDEKYKTCQLEEKMKLCHEFLKLVALHG